MGDLRGLPVELIKRSATVGLTPLFDSQDDRLQVSSAGGVGRNGVRLVEPG